MVERQPLVDLASIDMNTNDEQWLTGFLEGDGSIDFRIPRITLVQKDRRVLDYIVSVVTYGRVLETPRMFRLNYNGKRSLEVFKTLSKHVVSNKYLLRLNLALKHLGSTSTTSKEPTIDWLAGFFDAEGTSSNLPSLHIAQKERDVLDKITILFNGNVYQPKNNPCYVWALYGKNARTLVEELRERSHNPLKVQQLLNNFEGPTHYEVHKEEVTKYLRKRYQEHGEEIRAYNKPYTKAHTERQKHVREYIRTHPEEVAKILAKQPVSDGGHNG